MVNILLLFMISSKLYKDKFMTLINLIELGGLICFELLTEEPKSIIHTQCQELVKQFLLVYYQYIDNFLIKDVSQLPPLPSKELTIHFLKLNTSLLMNLLRKILKDLLSTMIFEHKVISQWALIITDLN